MHPEFTWNNNLGTTHKIHIMPPQKSLPVFKDITNWWHLNHEKHIPLHSHIIPCALSIMNEWKRLYFVLQPTAGLCKDGEHLDLNIIQSMIPGTKRHGRLKPTYISNIMSWTRPELGQVSSEDKAKTPGKIPKKTKWVLWINPPKTTAHPISVSCSTNNKIRYYG